MGRIYSLVSEVFPQLEDFRNSSNQELFKIQLGSNPHKKIDVHLMEISLKRFLDI